MSATGGQTLDSHLVGFVDLLRRAGLAVPLGSTLDFGRALAEIGISTRSGVYWAGRATLVRRQEDVGTYDEAFERHWMSAAAGSVAVAEQPTITLLLDVPEDAAVPDVDDGASDGDGDHISVRWSRTEVLASRDFADCTADELAELHDLMGGLRLFGATRRCRRLRPAQHRGRPDLRRTVRAALRTGGEPIHRAFSEPGVRPRRLVLLLDVSGSMEPYARALIRFLHAAMVGRRDVEAFALGTRLTRLTRELSTRDPDAALARAAVAVTDWSGGTRLGDGLRVFNDKWGVPGMARGATVVILSDGWDRGEPSVMEEQMGRLHRVAHQVVWVNPLKASPGYAPIARGMAAALPHVDRFVEGHSLDSLRSLVAVLADRVVPAGSAGVAHPGGDSVDGEQESPLQFLV
ncbi:MAG: VWA domain-containing protein [Acidimicrobiales bacterium]|nr:VWA domain-containing protein [Acidimicrobiales bacterium]